jgi:hypothetical protein
MVTEQKDQLARLLDLDPQRQTSAPSSPRLGSRFLYRSRQLLTRDDRARPIQL